MVAPDPILVLPLRQGHGTSNYKSFHTLPRAKIWPRMMSGERVAALSNISKEFISHVTNFKQVRKNGFNKSLKIIQRRFRKSCSAPAMFYRTRGRLRGKMRYGNKEHSLSYTSFIMFSVITNIYNKKTKGPSLMELFPATGKLIFLTTRDVRYVHHG